MSDQALRERLCRILADQLNGQVSQAQIRDDTALHGKGLGLSSLDLVSLVVKLEEEFDVFLEADEVAEGVQTFGTLLRTLGNKIKER